MIPGHRGRVEFARLARWRIAQWVALGVAIALVIVMRADAAPVRRAVTVPQWAIVFQHADLALGDITGLDVLKSVDRSPRALTRRPPGSKDWDDGPVWSPDGRHVAFVRRHEHEGLYVIAATGGRSRRLATGDDAAIAWSPDGSRVAVSRRFGRSSGVYVARTDGTGVQLLFPSPGFTSWSPDGRRLVCLCAGAIYTFDSDGANRYLLTAKTDGVLGEASWSPDGRLIAFGRHCGAPSRVGENVYCDLTVMNSDGTHKRTLLRHHGESGPANDAPSWFADNTFLIWARAAYQPGRWRVVSVDPRTGVQRILYRDVGWDLTPGPGHIFGLTVQSEKQIGTQRVTLVLIDAGGKELERRALPFGLVVTSLHIG